MFKGINMNKTFLLVISLLIVFIFSRFALNITGLAVGADVSVKEGLLGRVTLAYKSYLNISELQNITAEFTNIGSLPITTAKIEETIYFYNVTKLDPIAYYYDSSVSLAPGAKRFFKTVFMPPLYGTYYIKARVPYDTKVAEIWGAFSVTYTVSPPPPIIIVTPYTGPAPEWKYVVVEAGIPRITTDYQKNYNLYPGQSLLININVKNTGEIALYNLRLTTSTTNLVSTEINPKLLPDLKVNASTVFLISLTIPQDISPGTYPLNFELLSDKIAEYGIINLNITSYGISIKDDVYQKILNYDYLINELDRMITEAKSEGLNTTIAERSFEKAKEGLNRAKEYYDSEDYEGAKEKLDEIKKYFEDVVFQLAHARLKLQVAPAFSPFIIVVALILLAVFFLFVLRRRKREKRPKLLREVGEET